MAAAWNERAVKILLRTFVALVLLAGALTLPIASASAEADDVYVATYFSDGKMRSWVSFTSYGEHFTAWDRSKDDMSAAINWKVNGKGSYTLWATGYDNSEGFNADYPEGTPIKFRACVGHANQSGFLGCSAWQGATA
jgi:hypothetical protein